MRRGRLALVALSLTLAACGGSTGEKQAVEVVQTTPSLSQHLTRLADVHFGARIADGLPVIRIDAALRYQRIIGVGASLTDSSAWLIADELSGPSRTRLLRELFGPGGIGLRMLRVPIGASDFTRAGVPYTYDDVAAGGTDPQLAHFSIAHDRGYIIPTLRAARALQPGLQILASPWTPPAWMKTNDALDNDGDAGGLRPSDYGAYARYLTRFVGAYAVAGIPIADLTPANEPGQASSYPGLQLSEPDEARLVSSDLVPALGAAGLHVRLYGLDFAWRYWRYALALVRSPGLAHDLTGIAWHCYRGNAAVMGVVQRADPGIQQIVSECSSGNAPGPTSELMMAAFRNGASAALLWNLALTPQGGPVQPPNRGCPHCTGVVVVDPQSRSVRLSLDYYELGQIGSFVQPGAERIASNNFVTYQVARVRGPIDYATPGLDDVAFLNPDGDIVLAVTNNSRAPIRFAVQWRGRAFAYRLPAGAAVTFRWHMG